MLAIISINRYIELRAGGLMSKLGEFLKEIRLKLGFTLREVESLSRQKVSNAYLSLIESGKRTDPHPNILKTLAKVYDIKIATLMEMAGYLDENHQEESEESQVSRQYLLAINDPAFSYGRRSNREVDFETKKLIAKMYMELKKEEK